MKRTLMSYSQAKNSLVGILLLQHLHIPLLEEGGLVQDARYNLALLEPVRVEVIFFFLFLLVTLCL